MTDREKEKKKVLSNSEHTFMHIHSYIRTRENESKCNSLCYAMLCKFHRLLAFSSFINTVVWVERFFFSLSLSLSSLLHGSISNYFHALTSISIFNLCVCVSESAVGEKPRSGIIGKRISPTARFLIATNGHTFCYFRSPAGGAY